MDPFKTVGAVSWTELTTLDPMAAQAFYGALFGWRFEAMPMAEGSYHVIKLGDDDAIGGILATPALQERIQALGGVPAPMSPAQFAAKAAEDSRRFGAIIKERRISGD